MDWIKKAGENPLTMLATAATVLQPELLPIAPEVAAAAIPAASMADPAMLAMLPTLQGASQGLLGGAAALGDPAALGLLPTGEGAGGMSPSLMSRLLASGSNVTPMDALRLNGLLGNFNQQQPMAGGGGGQRPQQGSHAPFNAPGQDQQPRRRRGMADFLGGY